MKKQELDILYSLQEGKKSFWELLSEHTHLLGEFISSLNALYDGGYITKRGKYIFLTKKGRNLLNPRRVLFTQEICRRCGGKTICYGKGFKKVLSEFKRITKHRPRITPEFYQGSVTEEDTVARVALMNRYNDVVDKKILLIGDDDLVSIALALTHLPSRIVVFDIDKKLCEFIDTVSRKYNLGIETVEYDVSLPLPKSFLKKFDVFSTEPLETDSGFAAFVSRGASCLKRNGTAYIGISTLEVSQKRWRDFERLILGMNFAITDIIRDFSVYLDSRDRSAAEKYERFVKKLRFSVEKNPGIYWYKSTLVRAVAIGMPKPCLPWNKRVKLDLIDRESYTHPFLNR